METVPNAGAADPSRGAEVPLVHTPRVDPAHVRGAPNRVDAASEPASPAAVLAVLGQSSEHVGEQLTRQAADLSEQLRSLDREVSRREAELHALAAQVEREQRAARLWLRERQHELERRETELQERTQQQASAAAVTRAAALEKALTVRARQLDKREQELNQRELAWQEKQRLLDEQAAALGAAREDFLETSRRGQRELEVERQQMQTQWAGMLELYDRLRQNLERSPAAPGESAAPPVAESLKLSQLALRQRRCELLEESLQEQQAALWQDRAALMEERRSWQARTQSQRRTLAQRWRRRRRVVRVEIQQTAQQRERLEREREALEQLRQDVLRVHVESLEMRVAVEQVWQQCASGTLPRERTQQLADGRRRLAHQLSSERRAVIDQQQKLGQLIDVLRRHTQALRTRREAWIQWRETQQGELRDRAQQLAQHERELARREEQYLEVKLRWEQRRRRQEQQWRQLLQDGVLPAAASGTAG